MPSWVPTLSPRFRSSYRNSTNIRTHSNRYTARPMARRFSPATLALIALCLFGVLTGFVREFSGDFHYHVVLGQKTLASHHPYRIDDLSHTMAGKPMFISAWLGDVALAL